MGFKDFFKKKSTKELKAELEMEELKLKVEQSKARKIKRKKNLQAKIAETKRKTKGLKRPLLKKSGKLAKKALLGVGQGIATSFEQQQKGVSSFDFGFDKPKKGKKNKKDTFANDFFGF